MATAHQRGNDFHLRPKEGLTKATIVNIALFDDYTLDRHQEFRQQIEAMPSMSFVKDGENHHYIEYRGRFGRIQLHMELVPDAGITEWFEFLPNDLNTHAFFVPEIARLVDVNVGKYSIYILPTDSDRSHMTVRVQKGRITKVSWLPK